MPSDNDACNGGVVVAGTQSSTTTATTGGGGVGGTLPSCRYSSATIAEEAPATARSNKWDVSNNYVNKNGYTRPVFMMMTSDTRLDKVCGSNKGKGVIREEETFLLRPKYIVGGDNNANKQSVNGIGSMGPPPPPPPLPVDDDYDYDGCGDDEFEWEEVAPDGGWGWMVLFGSVVVNTLIPGLIKSFGVLFVEFLDVFDATPSQAAWIPGLTFTLYNLLGPLASAMSNRFSCRFTTMIGGLSATLGLALSYFATSIEFLYFSYGLLGGIGAGLSYTPGILIVGRYFEKRRGFANGVCMSGSALGSIILPPFINFLLSEYGYRGAILLMSGVIFNVCVGAMLYQPVEWHTRRVPKVRRYYDDDDADYDASAAADAVEDEKGGPVDTDKLLKPTESLSVSTKDRKVSWQINSSEPSNTCEGEGYPLADEEGDHNKPGVGASSPSSNFLFNRLLKDSGSPGKMPVRRQSEDGDTDVLSESSVFNTSIENVTNNNVNTSNVTSPVIQHTAVTGGIGGGSGGGGGNNNILTVFGSKSSSTMHPPITSTPRMHRAVSITSTLSSSSFAYLSSLHLGSTVAAYQHTEVAQLGSISELSGSRKYSRDRSPSIPKHFVASKQQQQQEWEEGKKAKKSGGCCGKFNCLKKCRKGENSSDSILSKLFDLSLIKNSLFLLITYSFATSAVSYTNLLIILPAHAVSLGFQKAEYAVLLSIIAGSDLTGRICGAWLSDLGLFPRKYFFIVGLIVSGTVLSAMPLATEFVHLATACAVFGLGSGAYIGLMAVLLMDHLGADRLSSSFGLSLALNGVVMLAGPPIVGIMREQLGSYRPVLFVLGLFLVSGGLIWILEPLATRHEKRKESVLEEKQIVV